MSNEIRLKLKKSRLLSASDDDEIRLKLKKLRLLSAFNVDRV